MEVVSSKVGAGDVKLLVTIFFFVVIVSFDGVVNAAGKERCQRTCGRGKSAIEVNYPFGFSEGCEIRLNCSKSGQRVKIGEFRVHIVTPNNIFVNVTPKCNRPLKEIEPFFGKNFGLTRKNSLLLQNCSSQAGLDGCMIPTGLIESRFRHEKCDARSDNISCYSEDKRGRKLELMNHTDLNLVKCTSLFSSLAVNFDTLELNRVELSWWLDGPCNCHQNANCTTVSLLDGSMGYRCSCKDGLHGDGFAEGEGCRKACAKCKGRCEEYARGMFYCRPNRTTLIINAITLGGGALIVIIVVFCFGMCKIIKRRRELKLKKKFFKRNGGLLLQQQLSSNENSFDTTKIFTVKELEKATDNFNISGVLGQGGQGTVYKGMLMDGTIVAVKKSTLVREGQVEQFINEVVILSQINHRNIVKLLGCCLETEVPLLVYEFISNGTLSQLIRSQEDEFPLSWEMRLQIATDISGALAYLHSASSIPIYHRDIKSSNILLDDKYRAKVADFGTSRSVAIDQTHLTTIVQGTFGYLDPEFFQSSQFTDKSDVYSFGVVLVELLTGQRPIMSRAGEEEKSLVAFFISALEEDSLFDIIDERVAREGSKDEVIALASLARRCLNLNGRQRPTMKELMFEIERIRISQMPSNISKKYHLVQSISEGNQNVEDNFSSALAPFLDYTGNPSSEFHVAR